MSPESAGQTVAVPQTLRQGFCAAVLGQDSFFSRKLFLLLSPLTDCLRPTQIIQGDLLNLKSKGNFPGQSSGWESMLPIQRTWI